MNLTRAFRIQSKEVVAFVGGGGKTTTMFSLASELVNQGLRVVTTTTTHIFADQIALAPYHIVHAPPQTDQHLTSRLANELAAHPHVLVVGEPNTDTNKAASVDPSIVETIISLPQVDCVLVEADGARMRPFKAPADHEPVVPDCTTLLVPVVGFDVLSKPLTDEYVHRAGLVARVSGAELGTPVTTGIVAATLNHPQGGMKGLPVGARVIPLINKVAIPLTPGYGADLEEAQDLAQKLMENNRVEAVVIGAVRGQTSAASWTDRPVVSVRARVAAIVLAAGASSRYGELKQLLPWQGGTLLSHVVDTALASQAGPVIVVLGNQAKACRTALEDRPVTTVVNERWIDGQSGSVRTGISSLPPNVRAALFLLVDQPLIKVSTINALIQRYWETQAKVTWPEYDAQRGNPVLFDRDLFPELLSISGSEGGRSVLRSHVAEAERVVVSDPGITFDIDTPQDYLSHLPEGNAE